MGTEAEFRLAPKISLISCGKIVLDLCVFYLLTSFQASNYGLNTEVAILR
jgi:hypothetical protein